MYDLQAAAVVKTLKAGAAFHYKVLVAEEEGEFGSTDATVYQTLSQTCDLPSTGPKSASLNCRHRVRADSGY